MEFACFNWSDFSGDSNGSSNSNSNGNSNCNSNSDSVIAGLLWGAGLLGELVFMKRRVLCNAFCSFEK